MASKKPGPTWAGHVSSEVKARYEAKAYDKMLLRIRKDGADGVTKDQIAAAAQASGQSINAWIIDAIKDKL